MIKLSDEQSRKMDQLHRSNFREFIVSILHQRASEHIKALKTATPELVRLVQGRAQELDDLIAVFSPKNN
jgi:hypothetical protein